MNRFLDRLVDLYTPLRLRGMLMDGHYCFAPEERPCGSRFSGDPAAAGPARPKQATLAAEAAPTGAPGQRARHLIHR